VQKNQRWSVVKKLGHPELPEITSEEKMLDRRIIGCPLFLSQSGIRCGLR
jgi:hypothetical protein